MAIEGRLDGLGDLLTILEIKVPGYPYVATITRGRGKHKKVIAQQVEKVFIQVVS